VAYDKTRSDYLMTLPLTNDVVTELIKLNGGLINKQLRKLGLLGDKDAEALGMEALYDAIRTFNSNKNSCLSTYASVCIFNRLGCYLRTASTKANSNVLSYDNTIDEEGNTFIDMFESPFTADDKVLQEAGVEYINDKVAECYSKASLSHKKILNEWIKSEFKALDREIAATLDCSQSYVNRVINDFRRVLKNKLKER
jgi:DNA-directed RNA polymerase specialized sigma subunit